MKYNQKYSTELVALLSKTAADKKLLNLFLKDLLTPKEYKELAIRWQIIKKLDARVTQRNIAEDLGVGIATVTRGSRELSNPKGGFAQVLKRNKK